MKSVTYRQAGVDISSARDFIQAIQPLARLTRRKEVIRGIGGFGGLFRLNGSVGKRPILVASSDGVGTKLKLAQRARLFEPLGTDLVAMNVNDILCVGAQPLFFLDYIAAGRLDSKVLLGVLRGVVKGCVESNCVLLGGETAQMPLVYGRHGFDLAGFAVGVVEEDRLVTGEKIKVGDTVLGLASNGVHANGFTLVQKVFSSAQLDRWSGELLQPTRIYVRPVLDLLRQKIDVRGIAHITGGSFQEKIPRILSRDKAVLIRKKAWRVPAVFNRIQAAGVSEAEMYRTFNMGIGMVLILPPKGVVRAQKILRRYHLRSFVIGGVIRGDRDVSFE